MALTVERLRNNDRFKSDSIPQFLLFLPFAFLLLIFRTVLGLILWIASIILPNKSTVRQMLSTLACWTFGVYVKVKGTRDPRCSVLVANYVSCLDSLAASHVLGTISLRKWKVPPFFASTLGIRNAAQFVRKQHFGECPSKPVLLQPEGGATSGAGLLRFSDWPFPPANRVQPVAISVERPFTNVAVSPTSSFPWRDAFWFLLSPVTVFHIQLLPPVSAPPDAMPAELANVLAQHLKIEATDYKLSQLFPGAAARRPAPGGDPLRALARQVKDVLPAVPLADIVRDLAITRSVDVTITNFLEGVTPYTPEPEPAAEPAAGTSQPRYITPAPVAVFPKSAKERQMSFQERKTQMIAEARQRYIEKHGINVAVNC